MKICLVLQINLFLTSHCWQPQIIIRDTAFLGWILRDIFEGVSVCYAGLRQFRPWARL